MSLGGFFLCNGIILHTVVVINLWGFFLIHMEVILCQISDIFSRGVSFLCLYLLTTLFFHYQANKGLQ